VKYARSTRIRPINPQRPRSHREPVWTHESRIPIQRSTSLPYSRPPTCWSPAEMNHGLGSYIQAWTTTQCQARVTTKAAAAASPGGFGISCDQRWMVARPVGPMWRWANEIEPPRWHCHMGPVGRRRWVVWAGGLSTKWAENENSAHERGVSLHSCFLFPNWKLQFKFKFMSWISKISILIVLSFFP
jgi:hypothetical protein